MDLLTITLLSTLFLRSNQRLRIENVKLLNFWYFSGVFSYVWLFCIVFVFSPLKIEFWEANLTLLFYVLFLVFSEIINKCLTPCKEFVLKKTSSNTLLFDKFHLDLESNLKKNKSKF